MGFPGDVVDGAGPVLVREHGEPRLDKRSVELGVVCDHEVRLVGQRLHLRIVNALAGDHFVGDVRESHDFRRQRAARILERHQRRADARDASAVDPEREWNAGKFDDPVVHPLHAGGLHIHEQRGPGFFSALELAVRRARLEPAQHLELAGLVELVRESFEIGTRHHKGRARDTNGNG